LIHWSFVPEMEVWNVQILESQWINWFNSEFGHRDMSNSCYQLLDSVRRDLDFSSVAFSDQSKPIASSLHIPHWALQQLSLEGCKTLLNGIRLKSMKSLETSSAFYRDELIQLAFHSGFSAYFKQSKEKNSWFVHFIDETNSLQPTFNSSINIKRIPYTGRVWCVEIPPHNLIIARHAQLSADGKRELVESSQPTIVGNCLHFWQLKSFWHEYPVVTGRGESDVEFHEFEKLEMTPPTLVSDTDKDTRQLVREMIAHKQNFESVRDSERYNELSNFWLRKSKQPVLSVLMVKKKNGTTKFYRGVNVEVSMPTGSLCAERNAIGSALAIDPTIVRKDMKMIAVLAIPLVKSDEKDKLTVKSEANEANPPVIRKSTRSASVIRSVAVNPAVQKTNSSLNTSNITINPSPEPFSPHSPHIKRRNEEAEGQNIVSPMNSSAPNPSPAKRGRVTPSSLPAVPITLPPPPSEIPPSSLSLTRIPSLQGASSSLSIFSSDSPNRETTELERTRSKTREKGAAGLIENGESEQPTRSLTPAEIMEEERKKQKLLEQELLMMKIRNEQKIGPDEGRNPINPCGACNEWLKKIAEVNPDFKVITFTSLDCSTVFVKPVKF
jgi:cytidine deaminase